MRFVELTSDPALFGEGFITLMMHCLTHLADECKRLGPLDSFTCFKYENTLKSLKRARSYRYPLISLSNQLQYRPYFVSKQSRQLQEAEPKVIFGNKLEHFDGPLEANYYESIRLNNIILSVHEPNCFFMDPLSKVLQILHIVEQDGLTFFICSRWRCESAYSFHFETMKPVESKIAGVFRLYEQMPNMETIELDQVERKCVVHTFLGRKYSYPLLPLS